MKNVYIVLFISFLFVVSCKENVALEYENDPALYFPREEYGQKDSIEQSFFLIPRDNPDTIYVKIQTMGYVYDTDRSFILEQINVEDDDAAIAGVHYVAFNDPQVSKYFVIPANMAEVRLPIIFIRDQSLNLKRVRLELSIVKNENFRPGIEKWTNFVVSSTAKASKPILWDSVWKHYFGASWGSEKMKFIIDVTGFTQWDVRPVDFGFLNFLKTKVLNKFQEYNDANPDNPLKEADETLVSFTS